MEVKDKALSERRTKSVTVFAVLQNFYKEYTDYFLIQAVQRSEIYIRDSHTIIFENGDLIQRRCSFPGDIHVCISRFENDPAVTQHFLHGIWLCLQVFFANNVHFCFQSFCRSYKNEPIFMSPCSFGATKQKS